MGLNCIILGMLNAIPCPNRFEMIALHSPKTTIDTRSQLIASLKRKFDEFFASSSFYVVLVLCISRKSQFVGQKSTWTCARTIFIKSNQSINLSSIVAATNRLAENQSALINWIMNMRALVENFVNNKNRLELLFFFFIDAQIKSKIIDWFMYLILSHLIFTREPIVSAAAFTMLSCCVLRRFRSNRIMMKTKPGTIQFKAKRPRYSP